MKNDEELEKIISTRIVRLNAFMTALVTGILSGGMLFIATIWLLIKGGDVVGPHLALLSEFFVGYTVSFSGSFVGLLYGFVTGFAIGYAIAMLYNIFLPLQEKE